MNLPTYPEEPIYIPDMLVAIVALHNYASQYHGEYSSTVKLWIERAKKEWIDKETGLLTSFLVQNGASKRYSCGRSYHTGHENNSATSSNVNYDCKLCGDLEKAMGNVKSAKSSAKNAELTQIIHRVNSNDESN